MELDPAILAVLAGKEFSLTGSSKYYRKTLDADLPAHTLATLYRDDPNVYKICGIVARKIASQPLITAEKKTVDGEEVTTPKVSKVAPLIERPNQRESYYQFMYRYATELVLHGNAIAIKLEELNELVIVPAQHIIPRIENNELYYYASSWGESSPNHPNKPVKIPASAVIHTRLSSQDSTIWGMSPFYPGRSNILFDRMAVNHLYNFYDRKKTNKSYFESHLKDGEDATKKGAEIKRYLEKFEKWLESEKKMTEPIPPGWSIKNLPQDRGDEELRENRIYNKNDVISLLNIPPHEMGQQASGSIGSHEAKEALKNFWQSTIIPFQNLISGAFSDSFHTSLKNLFFTFDNSDVKILEEDEDKKAERAAKLLPTHTINEIRAKIYKDPPLADGDLSPLERQLYNSAPGYGSGPPPATRAAKKSIPSRKSAEDFLQKHRIWWRKRNSYETRIMTAGEKKVFESTRKIQVKMGKKASRAVSKYLRTKSIDDDIQNIKLAIDQVLEGFEEEWVFENMPTFQSVADLGYSAQLILPFNLPNSTEIDALRVNNAKGRRAILAARKLESFVGISDTLTNDILDTVAEGLSENKTVQEIARDIDKYNLKEIIPNRSMVIARTEVLGAVSYGQKAAADDASELIPGLKKMWITARDDRVRESHQRLDGQIVDMDKKFKNGLEYPRDPQGPPGETIQCRCTWLLIPPGES